MIDLYTCCSVEDCPRKDECARHGFYLDALSESEAYTVLNACKQQVGENGCKHCLLPVQERIAYGFRHLYATVPVGNARKIAWSRLFSSDSAYYRTKRGDRALSPAMQNAILKCIADAGGDPETGFDRYEEVTVYKAP